MKIISSIGATAFAAILSVACLSGCACCKTEEHHAHARHIGPQSAAEKASLSLKNGMSRADVEKELGAPRSVAARGDLQEITYDWNGDDVLVMELSQKDGLMKWETRRK